MSASWLSHQRKGRDPRVGRDRFLESWLTIVRAYSTKHRIIWLSGLPSAICYLFTKSLLIDYFSGQITADNNEGHLIVHQSRRRVHCGLHGRRVWLITHNATRMRVHVLLLRGDAPRRHHIAYNTVYGLRAY